MEESGAMNICISNISTQMVEFLSKSVLHTEFRSYFFLDLFADLFHKDFFPLVRINISYFADML